MLQNILVPLDGSPVGETALPYAVALAGRSGAKLTLMRAAHVPPLTVDKAAAQVCAVAEAEAYLSLRADDLRARECVVETGVPYGGNAAEWIVEEADLRYVDLIVMATHDRVGPDRWFHGSVAEAVVSHAGVPVLLVRDAERMRPVEHFDWREPTLIVPLDGSDLAAAALPVGIDLARVLHGRLVLMMAVSNIPTDEPDRRKRLDAHEYLEALAERARRAGLPVRTIVRWGDAAHQIALTAREQNAAMVVMATHGRTGLARAVLGSVAGQVVRSGPSPVALVRPPTLHASEEQAAINTHAVVGA